MYFEEPLYDPRVEEYAEIHGMDVYGLDWHLEAVHGWEAHDQGYEEAIIQVADCLKRGGCEVDNEIEKD
jgi:hypothetical protein